jgi:predicted secreted protein
MASAAIDGLGVVLVFNGSTIGEVLDIEGPGVKYDLHEVTNHGSTGGYEEEITGIKRWEPIKFAINYVPSTSDHQALVSGMVAGTASTVTVTWPDGSTSWTGQGRVVSFMPKAPVNGVFTADVEIKPTGAWTGGGLG